jgi:uncharacterized protein YbcI
MEGPEHLGPGSPRPPSNSSVVAMAEQISREILAIQLDSYGHGADNVHAYLLDDTVLVLLDGLELTPSEEFMVSVGRSEAVIAMRNQFQQAIAATFKAVIERVTGRRVVGFASQQQVTEPRFAMELFRLGPA